MESKNIQLTTKEDWMKKKDSTLISEDSIKKMDSTLVKGRTTNKIEEKEATYVAQSKPFPK